jgi:Mn-containing catalase
MYHHIKNLMYTVEIGTPDPKFGNMLLEQFGGANGELAAAMQYSIQGLNCDDPERKDMRRSPRLPGTGVADTGYTQDERL